VDWVDFTREKSIDTLPPPLKGSMPESLRKKQHGNKVVPGSSAAHYSGSSGSAHKGARSVYTGTTPDDLSLQPLLGHFPGPNPLDTTSASGVSSVGRGIVHLFRHAPPPTLIASLDAHPVGESSTSAGKAEDWAGDRAEGEDGSLIAILAVPAWMRPADFLEFIGGWTTCLEGVRMIR
jgi:BRCA1-associated protein